MRHLKNTFLSALKWQKQTGAGLLAAGDGKSVEEYIKKICPFYTYLEEIFGQRINIQPPAVFESSESVQSESLLYEGLEIDLIDAENLLTSSPCSTSSSEAQEVPLATSSPLQCTNEHSPASKKNLKRPKTTNVLSLLFDIQKQKVDLEATKLQLEATKLQLEKEKEENSFKLRKLQLEKEERIDMEKLRLEHDRFINK